ncbi:oxalate/formate antiporter [Cavenderia fasciculata]|uniref:Oxalate/formate antiporter n=1 Tax=Cavenderia fasciculata TaxID=261658 RepID=F4PJT5_CACFS|nr:oxalate/formate antiporter [Cavenderia fasciculata]EGG23859.1 oxalate/formate antiporter [Cavenderia fasciculata]|eukprot:XP_004361710.1 oxalate/formate antiporter [Cavenderia fasciculata]
MEEPLPTTTTDGNSNTNTNSPNTNSSITIDETSNLSTSSDNIYVENMVKMNPFLQCFVNYYSSSPNHKESVILNPHYEDIYLPGGRIKFNRWFLFPSAFIVQFCIGSLYASSIFNKPIDAYIFGNPAAGMAPITFYIAVALFGTSACLLGPWVERVGPRISMVVGSGLFTIGHFITAFGIHQKAIWEVYVGYGVIGGIGLGITYLSPISCLQKWFCDKRGLAAGFAVCGFGAGAIGFSQSLLPIIDKVGLPITYVILGIIFICVIWPQAILFRVPPPNYVINGVRVDGRKEAPKKRVVVEEDGAQISRNIAEEPTIEDDIFSREKIPLSYALTSREFRLIYVVFLCNAIFGLAAMSRLSNMIQDIFGQSKEAAALVVGVNGAFNLVGRLGFAFVSDLYGRKSCFIAMLSIQTVIIATATPSTTSKYTPPTRTGSLPLR